MAPTPTILRFPQTRKKSAFVLVQATSTGSHPLDLRLVGTDGFSPFVATCKWPPLAFTLPRGILFPRVWDPLPAMFMRQIARVSRLKYP
ncbi:hypothetical protein IMZ48_12055 [Candidatus Bathyarchaeota archaeon]|nr:hypothetical protein [Candidatus Bathyarchaeota archaeon]